MAGPRKKFRERPKKLGAKKRQRVNAQKRRLLAAGVKKEDIDKLTDKEVRTRNAAIGREKRRAVIKKRAKAASKG